MYFNKFLFIHHDYESEVLKPIYKEEEIKPIYKEEIVRPIYKEETKPFYETAEILKPVYKEEIKSVYEGERELGLHINRPGYSVFEPEFTPQHVIEFIKPEYRRQF